LVGRRNRREKVGSPDPYATNRIFKQRCGERPNSLWRGAFQHVERANPHHGIGIGEARFYDVDVGRRKVRREFRKGAGAREPGRLTVRGGSDQQRFGVGAVGPCVAESLSVMLKAIAFRAVPALNCVRRPLNSLVRVAIVAGVRRPKLDGDVGPRNAYAVIVARIDDHVGARRHVTRGAADRRIDALMPVVSRNGIFGRRVTLQANGIAR